MVHVIVYKGTLWGLHTESPEHDGSFRTQVVAFEDGGHAQRMAERLWAHRLTSYKWPETVLEGRPLWIRSAEDILLTSPSPLKVDAIELQWLLLRLSCTGAAVSLIAAHEEDEGDVLLKGQYLCAAVPMREKVDWLNKMHKIQAPPRD